MDKNQNKVISFRRMLQLSGRPVKPITPKKIIIPRPTPKVDPRNIVKTIQFIHSPSIKVMKSRKDPRAIQPRAAARPATRPVIKPSRPTSPQKPKLPIFDQNTSKIEALKDIGTGRILVMIAAGPSVTEVDLTPLKQLEKVDMMCINKPYMPVWPTKYWAFCDHTQYNRNKEYWEGYKGIIINSPNVSARKSNQIIIRSKHGKGFSRNLIDGFYIGRSTTYANLQTAHYMNYDKIFIFGIDMTEVGGKLHHYGVNPDVDPNNRKQRFSAEADHYSHAAKLLPEEYRKRYYFCSSYNPWNFVKEFNHLDHKTAVDFIMKSI